VAALLFKVTHPSLFPISQIRGVSPRINILRLDPSVLKSIRTVRQPEQLLEPYGFLFKMKEKQKQFTSQPFCREKKYNKHY
jgi:hypothetical protein